MNVNYCWILPSDKNGLTSAESYIIGRGDYVYLRILGKAPEWQIMTATASEDDGGPKVVPDRMRLVKAAFTFGHRLKTEPRTKTDWKGREYVQICDLFRADHMTDEAFSGELEGLARDFFNVFDQQEVNEIQAREEMIDIYQSLADDDLGGDIYLSDGVWLSSDGSVNDLGR